MGLIKYLAERRFQKRNTGNGQGRNARIQEWRKLSLESAVIVDPFLGIALPNEPIHDPVNNWFPNGKRPLALESAIIELDDMTDVQEPELSDAVNAGTDLLWAWTHYIQAGHSLAEQKKYEAALRAFLNAQRLWPYLPTSKEPRKDLNVAYCLAECGHFGSAAIECSMLGEQSYVNGEKLEAAEAWEQAGLFWNRLSALGNSSSVGTSRDTYNNITCFRRAAVLYAEMGEHRNSSRCHVLERLALQRTHQPWHRRLAGWAMKVLWLYGESPRRVGLSLLLLWIVSGSILLYTGFESSNGAIIDYRLALDASLEGVADWGTALYFSAVTMSTLGYGDIHPIGWGSRCVCAIEAISGMFLVAMFLISMQRRHVGR